MANVTPIVEKRKFTRIPFQAAVHIVSVEGNWQSELIDVSLQGVLVTTPEKWHAEIDDHYLIELQIEDSDISIRMEAAVAHINDNSLGFQCKHIDLDSITHLRRLVELNIGDSSILSRELSALGS